jgi:hypothetical protein
MNEIHTCSYYCEKPECIKAQRDELRDNLKNDGWVSIDYEMPKYGEHVLAWIYLEKNPIGSGCVIASRVYVEKDAPEEHEHLRATVGCWFANERYYSAGHVTHWMPLPKPPEGG